MITDLVRYTYSDIDIKELFVVNFSCQGHITYSMFN